MASTSPEPGTIIYMIKFFCILLLLDELILERSMRSREHED